MSWVLAALGFMVLIVLHEAGHFTAAKLVGMRVEKFALFFGPPIWKKQVGETEYSIRTIPAGGYVKITGMNPISARIAAKYQVTRPRPRSALGRRCGPRRRRGRGR